MKIGTETYTAAQHTHTHTAQIGCFAFTQHIHTQFNGHVHNNRTKKKFFFGFFSKHILSAHAFSLIHSKFRRHRDESRKKNLTEKFNTQKMTERKKKREFLWITCTLSSSDASSCLLLSQLIIFWRDLFVLILIQYIQSVRQNTKIGRIFSFGLFYFLVAEEIVFIFCSSCCYTRLCFVLFAPSVFVVREEKKVDLFLIVASSLNEGRSFSLSPALFLGVIFLTMLRCLYVCECVVRIRPLILRLCFFFQSQSHMKFFVQFAIVV